MGGQIISFTSLRCYWLTQIIVMASIQTDDNLYAVVFSTGPGSLELSIGSSHSTTAISTGVNKIKLPLSPGSPTARLLDSEGKLLISFSPSGFTYVTNPPAYNFNYYLAASP
jgi:glucan endo-1,3-alpha-glucosidase